MLRLRLNREIEGALLPAAWGRRAKLGTERLGEARLRMAEAEGGRRSEPVPGVGEKARSQLQRGCGGWLR